MSKTASTQLDIGPGKMHMLPIPKISILIAVTTKNVKKKAKK